MDRARSGDPDAFAVLFREQGDEVLRVCVRLLGGADAAADAQSDVFLKARRGFESYDPARPFRAWLLSIASHHCIDILRRQALERRVFVDLEGDAGDEADPDTVAPAPLTRLLARERKDALDAAIGALPLQYRLPLVMRYYSEASYDEIAESLGTNRSQVGSLLFRAKKRLREAMRSGPEGGQR